MSEKFFLIAGSTKLHGSVRLGGAKNSSYKLMIASLLGSSESRLLNFSHITDVELVADIIKYLGCTVIRTGERAISIDPKNLSKYQINVEHGEQGRFSTMFIPVLLHKFGQAIVPAPGGDQIGTRSLDRHFAGLQALGAKISYENGVFIAKTAGLIGTRYHFAKNTHTGTETLIMAAVLAKGTTILENAAAEPEIDDLIAFLNNLGARIKRTKPRIIEINGVSKLGGAIHQIIPDRNEAVSYACAALATKGDVILENARPDHLKVFLKKVAEAGGGFEIGNYGIRFYYQKPLRATNITTAIEPGFMTDWQPLWGTLMTQAIGTSMIHETVMGDRLQYTQELTQMGANIQLFNPPVKQPDRIYNFNLGEDYQNCFHAAMITGPTPLAAGKYVVKNLRHGACLVLASLIAKGKSQISNISQIERGYEKLDERLNSMGASIKIVTK